MTTRTIAREQAAGVRSHNFGEVCEGYSAAQAQAEATRCLQCKKPHCRQQCPVSLKIPQFISEVKQNRMAAAAAIIAEDSSLPAICGRVCPQEQQCEGKCILGVKGQPVAIGLLERFVADWAAEHAVSTQNNSTACREEHSKHALNDAQSMLREPFKACLEYHSKHALNGIQTKNSASTARRRVAVIGSGPAGLACAADLAKMGYYVKIFEALHKAGGVLQYGIPEFRLPKEKVVQREIDNVRALGVDIECNVVVGRTISIDKLMDEDGYDAVFIGTGAGLPKFMGIQGENLNGVLSANELLTRANLMKAYDSTYSTPIFVGKKTAVIGGGNVAMDAARVALRLGADVSIVYRRSEAELPARAEEVHHAKEEGIHFCMLTNPVEILGNSEGWVSGIRCVRMELGAPDSSGRRSPVAIPDSEFDMDMDAVVMALGTSPNPLITAATAGLQSNKHGCLVCDEVGTTTRAGVFAGGDVVSGAATVILAMGAGRRAAAAIHDYLLSRGGE